MRLARNAEAKPSEFQSGRSGVAGAAGRKGSVATSGGGRVIRCMRCLRAILFALVALSYSLDAADRKPNVILAPIFHRFWLRGLTGSEERFLVLSEGLCAFSWGSSRQMSPPRHTSPDPHPLQRHRGSAFLTFKSEARTPPAQTAPDTDTRCSTSPGSAACCARSPPRF